MRFENQKHWRPTMKTAEARFEIFADPCSRWNVWDRKQDCFASVGGAELVFLSRAEARRQRDALNGAALKARTQKKPSRYMPTRAARYVENRAH
jgi:hypothetical protein